MTTLPPITNKQQQILKLIYKHRFLNTPQIQTLIKHKEKRRSTRWLKDLKEKQYIDWIYEPYEFALKTKPAIYYLELNGIRFLRTIEDDNGNLMYPAKELRKRYNESTRTRTFIDHCLLLADCCINMEARTAEINNLTYLYNTEADYADPENYYHFLSGSEFIHPHLCYTKAKDTKAGIITTTNLLEIIDSTLPRHSLRKRLKDYVAFLDSDEWQKGTKDNKLPIVLIASPSLAEMIYSKRQAKKLRQVLYGDNDDDTPENVKFRFTTTTKLKEHGITASIWEEV